VLEAGLVVVLVVLPEVCAASYAPDELCTDLNAVNSFTEEVLKCLELLTELVRAVEVGQERLVIRTDGFERAVNGNFCELRLEVMQRAINKVGNLD
jgi:hypothetical protein